MKKLLLAMLLPICGSFSTVNAQQYHEVGRIDLGANGSGNVMGVKIGPDGKIWYVDRTQRAVYRIENDSHDPNNLASYLEGTNTFTDIVSGPGDRLINPLDIDFHPTRANELWVLNQGTTNTGGNTVTVTDAGGANQAIDQREDGNAWHFMALATALAFGDDGNWATSQGIQDANRQGGVFTGPTLWPGDMSIYAMVGDPPSQTVNGSHLDMIHQSPFSMGIAHEVDNVYWVFDGWSDNIVRYDFVQPHYPGGADHSDGIVRRYTEVEVERKGDLPAHLVVDKSKDLLFICDTDNGQIIELDLTSGQFGTNLTPMSGEPLAEYSSVINTDERVIATGMGDPVGIDVQESTGMIIVTDNANSDIIFLSTDPNAGGGGGGNPVGIQDNEQKKFSFSLYPNPTNGIVTIGTLNAPEENVTMNVFDIMGKRMIETKINLASSKQIDLSELPDGMYTVTMGNSETFFTQRLMINH